MYRDIDWILFDADHTLFDFDRSSRASLESTLSSHDVSCTDDQYNEYFEINHACWQEYERGEIAREVLAVKRFEIFFEKNGITGIDTNAFNNEYLSGLPNYPYMMDSAIETLHNVRPHVQLGLITNGLKEVQRPRLKSSGIGKFFDIIVVSGEIGYAKPDSAYFQYAFEKMALPQKERVLVVGDSLFADIYGGMSFGFKACWFNPVGRKDNLGVNPDYEAASHIELREILGL